MVLCTYTILNCDYLGIRITPSWPGKNSRVDIQSPKDKRKEKEKEKKKTGFSRVRWCRIVIVSPSSRSLSRVYGHASEPAAEKRGIRGYVCGSSCELSVAESQELNGAGGLGGIAGHRLG